MFLVSLLVICALSLITWVYCKLKCGICRSSRHLVGKTVIVTGGNGGIGFETAKDLAERGARVILACRDERRGTAARDEIVAATGNSDVHYRNLDLASLKTVRLFAANIIQTEKRLDILVNNAGSYGTNFEKTEDGLLLPMQTNHFGPFLLTNLLLPILKSSAPSRIVNVASDVHIGGVVDFDNLNGEKDTDNIINDIKIYCNTKLCNILMTVELDRQLKGTGVTANALHPGVVSTGFGRTSLLASLFLGCFKPFCKTPWEGAQTSIHLAVAAEVAGTSGRYLRDCREVKPTKQARDIGLARRLWEESKKHVKLNVSVT